MDADSRREWVLAALEQYEGRLNRYAMRLLRDEHAARDAVQHAFLRLCEQDPEELDSRTTAWLFTVCRNKARDLVRGNGRAKSLAAEFGENGPNVSAVAGSEPEPGDVAEADELHERLRALIDRLPALQREAIDLWREGFSHREISDITERSKGAVRVAIHRALTKLREHPQVKAWLDDDSLSRR